MQGGGDVNRDQKRRRVSAEEHQQDMIPRMIARGRSNRFVLNVEIKSVENPSSGGIFDCTEGIYQVYVTDSQSLNQCRTSRARGNAIYPNWRNEVMSIEFRNLPENEHLYVEVLQYGKKGDPTSSTGAVVIGRARIPVPDETGFVYKRDGDLISFTPAGKTVGGVISLDMTLRARKFRH